jgi:hypothetical protein
MSSFKGRSRLIPLAIAATTAALYAPVSMGSENGLSNGNGDEDELEFDEARLYFELNHTDRDLGIHGLIDGDAWKSLKIEDPNEQELMSTWIRGRLRRQGLTEFFFESDEPPFSELPPAQFFARFPEGTYEIEGVTLDGEEIEGEVKLSHVMAAPPGNIRINSIRSAVNCDAEDLPVVSEPVTLDWNAVTMSHPSVGTPGVPVKVKQYEVVGEIEREGRTPELLVFSVIVPPWVTRFEFPEDFTRLATDEVKFEIVTKLANGNQTAVESCFEIE